MRCVVRRQKWNKHIRLCASKFLTAAISKRGSELTLNSGTWSQGAMEMANTMPQPTKGSLKAEHPKEVNPPGCDPKKSGAC